MANSILLIATNLGSLFEQLNAIEPLWSAEIYSALKRSGARFAVIHIQELGGKEFEEGMKELDEFIRRIQERVKDLGFRLVLNLDSNYHDTDNFTALGALTFIHESVSEVDVWNFTSGQYDAIPNVESYSLSNDHFLRQKFHMSMFPPVDTYKKTPARKGYSYVRYRVLGQMIDTINMHLFHDDNNFQAMKKSPSIYTVVRRYALDYVMNKVRALNNNVNPAFFFGDFNFRLSLGKVLEHMQTEETEVESVHNDEGKLHVMNIRHKPSSKSLLNMEAKAFKHSNTPIFTQEKDIYRKFDEEVGFLEGMLKELPVTFEPSYAYSESVDQPDTFLEKRCPAWCDRILMNDIALDLVGPSAHYDMIGRGVCTGDHKPVELVFTL